jgi:acetyl esterase/lipase
MIARRIRRLGQLARRVPAGLFGLAVGACSPVGFLNGLVPTDGYTRTADVRYADGPRGMLDVYVPDPPPEKAPVVVFFYGGSWEGGQKADYLFAAQGLVARGWVVVVPDYRVWPEVRFPAFVEDGAAATAWVLANAARYGGDPERVYVMGHSAGAHIAAMLALDPDWLASKGADRDRLAGLIGLAGPYDFLPLKSDTLKQIFETEDPAKDPARTQPITFAAPGAPPTLLATGTADHTVRARNSVRLAAALEAAGVPVTLVRYDKVGHVGIVLGLTPSLPGGPPVLDDVAAFIAASGPGS